VNLAAALAQKGQRVLMVDLDPQAHATLGLGYEPDNLDTTIYHSLAGRQIPISKVIISTRIKGLDLAPSNIRLAKAEQELVSISRKEFILADQLKAVSSTYDICVIDCPPSLGLLTFSALVASTDVIVPVQVHYYALEGLKQLLETVKTARKRFYPCSVKILGILLTFVEGKAALSQQVEQQMRQFFGDLVFDTVINRTISLAEAPSAGQSISTYAPQSKGAADYRALAAEVTDPEYKKKRRLPKEVSAIVEEVESAEEAEALRPSLTGEAIEQIIPSVTTEAPEEIPQPVSGRKAVRSTFTFLAVASIVLIIVVVGLMLVMNMVNIPPVAEPGSVTIQEDIATLITLTASDSDGDQLTYHQVTGPSHGTLSGTGPRMTYTPESNYSGPDSFTFIANDGAVDSNAVTVSVTVEAINDAPAANHQSVTTKVDRSVSITLAGTDADGDTFKYSISTQPEHGTLGFGSSFDTNGKLVYTPGARFTGTDSFTFRLDDGTAKGAAATVSVNVTPNHAPMAELQVVNTAEDTPAVVNLAGSDQDGDTLVYSVVTGPSHGKLSGTAPNLTYTPNRDFNGPDSFTFKVNDGTADSALTTVSITITPVNDRPIATSDNVTTLEDMPVSIALAGIDPDGNPLTYAIVAPPSGGSLSGTEPNMTYTPNLNFNGSDRFTFKVNDGTADSAPAAVSLMVTPADDPPTANNDPNVTVDEDASVLIVLTGDDPDGDPLTYRVLRTPTHGKLSGTPPSLTYTPDPNFSWLDNFTFRVNDGTTDSAAATVYISVTPVNDPPTANDDKVMTQEDTPAMIDVLVNDTEVDNELLKVSAVTQGTSGVVVVNADGTLTYTPKADFYGTDAFTYTVSDREGEKDTATVKVAVSAANDPPAITSEPVTEAMVGVLYTYDVNATDPDGSDTLIYSLATQPAGMMIHPATGVIQWTPAETQDKTNDVVVRVEDSDSVPASATQPFKISVKPTPPKMATLTIVDGYDHRSKKTLSASGKTGVVQAGDNKRQEIQGGSYISYDFSDVSVPAGATITSVVVYVEHFEEQQFAFGKLRWELGTGWPGNPVTWISANAPVRKGEANEAIDSWDITSFTDTAEKLRSFQFQIKNNDNVSKRKTSVDYIYAVVEWSWPVPRQQLVQCELELIRP
jgi:cellulose biosynthesis protein BcsQ